MTICTYRLVDLNDCDVHFLCVLMQEISLGKHIILLILQNAICNGYKSIELVVFGTCILNFSHNCFVHYSCCVFRYKNLNGNCFFKSFSHINLLYKLHIKWVSYMWNKSSIFPYKLLLSMILRVFNPRRLIRSLLLSLADFIKYILFSFK